VDSTGAVVLEKYPETRKVFSEETSFLMSDILKGVITGGTATGNVHTIQNADGESIAVAGKTGTTDDYRDRWFCGYTPYYAAAVWYGYDNLKRTTEIPKGEDRNSAMKIWDYVMQGIHVNLAGADFVRPDSIVTRTVCIESGLLANQYCKEADTDITDYFILGDYLTPTSTCTFHIEPTPEPTIEPEVPPETTPSP
jgi:penicillin-binding protein 1A